MTSNSEARKRTEPAVPRRVMGSREVLSNLYKDRHIRDFSPARDKDRPGEIAYTIWFDEALEGMRSVPFGTRAND